jgi:hypothetical protein
MKEHPPSSRAAQHAAMTVQQRRPGGRNGSHAIVSHEAQDVVAPSHDPCVTEGDHTLIGSRAKLFDNFRQRGPA